jgi:hypothetical protein
VKAQQQMQKKKFNFASFGKLGTSTTTLLSKERLQQLIDAYCQFVAACSYFGLKGEDAELPPERPDESAEMKKDRVMFKTCKELCREFGTLMEKHSGKLYACINKELARDPEIVKFHEQLRNCMELHYHSSPEGGEGGVVLTLIPNAQDRVKHSSATKMITLHVEEDLAKLLCLCHAVYWFFGYATRTVFESLPPQETDNKISYSFVSLWNYMQEANEGAFVMRRNRLVYAFHVTSEFLNTYHK